MTNTLQCSWNFWTREARSLTYLKRHRLNLENDDEEMAMKDKGSALDLVGLRYSCLYILFYFNMAPLRNSLPNLKREKSMKDKH